MHPASECPQCTLRAGTLIDGDPSKIGGRTLIEVHRTEFFALSLIGLSIVGVAVYWAIQTQGVLSFVGPVILGLLGAAVAGYALLKRQVIVVDSDKDLLVVSRRGPFVRNDDRFIPLDEITRVRLDEYKSRRWKNGKLASECVKASVSVEMEYGEAHGLGSGEPWPANRQARILQRLLRVPLVKRGAKDNPTEDRWSF